jgi:hypothetical protein
MIAIGLLFVRMLCDCFKSRRRLEAEILVLWHQLNVLQQRAPRRRLHLRWVDRARPRITKEVRDLIRRMSLENPLWGACPYAAVGRGHSGECRPAAHPLAIAPDDHPEAGCLIS